MEISWIIAAIALVVAAFALWAAFGRRASNAQPSNEANALNEMLGRLAQISESSENRHNQLTRTLEERLEAVSKRLGDGLNLHTEKTGTTMKQVHERLAVIDAAQKNLTDLSAQVDGLQNVLSNKQARGAFGEVQLQDLVSDILPPSAYSFQTPLKSGARPDCLLRLPNPPGSIAIDSKFPLESYRAMAAAMDDTTRNQSARQFTTDIKKHVTDIAGKYIVPGETAEYAIMFLPSEAVYAELHTNFANLVEDSHRLRVAIVSPATMMGTLTAIRAILKDARMREQAHIIQVEVMKLMEDVGRLDDRVENLGKHFGQAAKDIELINTSSKKIKSGIKRVESIQLEDDEKLDGTDDTAPGLTANEP